MLGHIEDGIGWMTFNNPARHNALSLEMWLGMAEIMTATRRAQVRTPPVLVGDIRVTGVGERHCNAASNSR
jgi:enoyl-CoA hydratase/carnithine racemase